MGILWKNLGQSEVPMYISSTGVRWDGEPLRDSDKVISGVVKARVAMKAMSGKKGHPNPSSQKSKSAGATTQPTANPSHAKRDGGGRGGFGQGGKSAKRGKGNLASLTSRRDNVNPAIITALVSINNFFLTTNCLLDSGNEQVDYASTAVADWLEEHGSNKRKKNCLVCSPLGTECMDCSRQYPAFLCFNDVNN
jgi:hypothetical protein